jgi:hypothetical protein
VIQRSISIILTLACGAFACGPAPQPAPPVARLADAPPPPPPPPNGDTCPTSFSTADGECSGAQVTGTCSYPEGTCYCGVEPRCSGAVMNPDDLGVQPTTWICTAKPPRVRPDGCPGTAPSPSDACSPSGKQCTYGSCCVSTYTCKGGTWKETAAECPP